MERALKRIVDGVADTMKTGEAYKAASPFFLYALGGCSPQPWHMDYARDSRNHDKATLLVSLQPGGKFEWRDEEGREHEEILHAGDAVVFGNLVVHRGAARHGHQTNSN